MPYNNNDEFEQHVLGLLDRYLPRACTRVTHHLSHDVEIIHADECFPVMVELTRQTGPHDPSLLRFNRSAFKRWLRRPEPNGPGIRNYAPIFAALDDLGFIRKEARLCPRTRSASPKAPIFEAKIRWRDKNDIHKGYDLM